MADADAKTDAAVLIRIAGSVGRITLNRPKALNALTLEMVRAMTEALLAWRRDDAVKAVLIDGTGDRAFCAGGDIRALHDSGKADGAEALAFWSEEYQLNRLIRTYPKPYVALIDGVVMGGGVGVSVHGSHRVTGDATKLAMPETGIGFFPDVGGTYVLAHLIAGVGQWMGLTGARLTAADALALGLATHHIPSAQHAAFTAALESAALDADGEVLEDLLDDYAGDPGDAPVAAHLAAIGQHFSLESVAAIQASLAASDNAWARAQLDTLNTKSPTSLRITHQAIREAEDLSFDEAITRELHLAMRILKGPDFYEGVRAVIIDKDNAPTWSPSRLEDVTDAAIAAMFAVGDAPALVFHN